MKKISVIFAGVVLGISLLHASSTEKDASMKCGSGMNMQAKEVSKKSMMKEKSNMNMKDKKSSMMEGKCGASHMEKSSGKCGDDK